MNSDNQIKVGLFGSNGRMGRELIQGIAKQQHLALQAPLVRKGHGLIGLDAGIMAGCGELNVPLVDADSVAKNSLDVMIDFTLPEALETHLAFCVQHKVAAVVGTTGLSAGQMQHLYNAVTQIPIVFAPNMSVGVNLLLNLLKTAASVIGEQTDIEIVEAHHRFKKDAPSGTAVRMGEVIADTLGRNLAECAIYGRQGVEDERDRKTIGFSTIRAGDIVGEHTAIFADLGERLELTHKASNRQTFVSGALRAAAWVISQPPGLYDMQDVLGLKS